MAVTTSSDAIDSSLSSTSLSGLDGVNFFLAGMQSGFGPFVAVLLADEKWTQQNIGLAGLLSQLPGGELLDASRSKRFLVALGGIIVAVSALAIALWPSLSGLVCQNMSKLAVRRRRAPSTGRQAQSWGRRPLLLIGFGALTVRALLV
jgi:hypothetical protein